MLLRVLKVVGCTIGGAVLGGALGTLTVFYDDRDWMDAPMAVLVGGVAGTLAGEVIGVAVFT